jgi:predicted dinucleotide-binding enzyme
MRVGILGSGLMGGKLGTLFARAGHEVVFSPSGSAQSSSFALVTPPISGRSDSGSLTLKVAEVLHSFGKVPP